MPEKRNQRVATLTYSEAGWGRGGVDWETRRKRVRCSNVPEALRWLLGGKRLGELERILYAWVAAGMPDDHRFDDKIAIDGSEWVEDLHVSIKNADGEGDADHPETGDVEAEYARDFFSYLGLEPGKDGDSEQ